MTNANNNSPEAKVIKTPITKEQFDQFCELTATTAQTKKVICKQIGISDPSVDKYLRIIGDEAVRQYALAKIDQCEQYNQAMHDKIHEYKALVLTIEDSKRCAALANICRTEIDVIKWDMSKRMPKVYGDKIDVTTNSESINRNIEIVPISQQASNNTKSSDSVK